MAQDHANPVHHTGSPPHRPRNPTSTPFMSLPREIRDEIYTLVLVSPCPIIVWKGEWVYEQLPLTDGTVYTDYADYADFYRHTSYVWRRVTDQPTSKASLYSLSTNLLFCSYTISQEAALVFYNKNTFSFLGDHNWDPIVSWLDMIGTQNQNYLSNLDISAYTPDQAWQRSNGERIEHPATLENREVIYPRNLHLLSPIRPFKRGLVDNINPALETIFRLLGSRERSMQKVTLNFKLFEEYPGQGAIIEDGDQHPEKRWHSLDLPNLVEKFRILHAYQPGDLEPLVEVLWKGESHPVLWHRQDGLFSRIVISDHLQNIEDRGWQIDILPKEHDTIWKPNDKSYNIPTYVLKRKKLTEPLMGNDPNPYSHSGKYIILEQEELDFEEITG